MSIKILFGTKNPAKLEVMTNRLTPLGIELISLNDLEEEIPQVEEDGKTPLENARKKALAYFEAFKMPVFSCDSGLYIDELPDELQPGCKVRRVNGKTFNDDEMIEYYTMLAEKYGICQADSRGEDEETEALHTHLLTARYKNAICFVKDKNTIYESMDKAMESEPFFITSKPYGYIRKEGFPIDSISVHISTGKYYYDMDKSELDKFAVEDGVLTFFRNIYNKQLMEVNGNAFTVIKLLGKGKGGYSYLVSDGVNQYVLKQIHHEPCDYYQFGNKIEAEMNDYKRLKSIGIRIPDMIDADIENERILKEYIDGDTIYDIVLKDEMKDEYIAQVKAMCELLYPANTNIDYFPTNFVVQNGEIFYIDFECNNYMEEWNFENWGVKYWSKTPKFLKYVEEHSDETKK